MSFNITKQLPSLFDDGSFVELFDSIVEPDGANSLLCGVGQINNRSVFCFLQNGNITSANIKKIIKLYNLALENNATVVGFYNSNGINIVEGIELLDNFGELVKLQNELSGRALQLSVVFGDCIGINAIFASCCDIIIMAEGASFYPTAIRQAAPETVGSADAAAKTGAVHLVVKQKELIEKAGELLALVLNPAQQPPAEEQPAESYEVFANFENQPTQLLLEAVFDKNSIFTMYNNFGAAALTAFARLNGKTIAAVATNGNLLDASDAVKIARLVQLADSLGMPIITFINSDGFSHEESNSARDYAKLIYAYAQATVPKIAVCSGKVYGASYLTFASKGTGTTIVAAWDSAIISLLSPETTVAFLKGDTISSSRSRGSLEEDYAKTDASPTMAAQIALVDKIIKPEDTRNFLTTAVNLLNNSKNGKKNHSNIPF